MTGQGRPTATLRPRDVSGAGFRASAAPVSPMRRTEDCICGGEIVAVVGFEAAAVDEHNLSLLHQEWRYAKEHAA